MYKYVSFRTIKKSLNFGALFFLSFKFHIANMESHKAMEFKFWDNCPFDKTHFWCKFAIQNEYNGKI